MFRNAEDSMIDKVQVTEGQVCRERSKTAPHGRVLCISTRARPAGWHEGA